MVLNYTKLAQWQTSSTYYGIHTHPPSPSTRAHTPHCCEHKKPLDSKTHINRLLTILSIVLHKQLVKVIGRYLLGSEEPLPGFGIATTVASFREGAKIPDSQMESKTVNSRGIHNCLED